MKNFPIKINKKNIKTGTPEEELGKVIWNSRAMAVAVFIFCKDEDNGWYVAATQRGSGCPNFVGDWCCPCGYVDFDETITSAAKREVFEETGLIINDLRLIGIHEDKELRQNVTFRYVAVLRANGYTLPELTDSHSEENEIEQLEWVPLGHIDTNDYDWAFNHNTVIFEAFQNIRNKNYNEIFC